MVNDVGITRAEYEERRHAFELSRWVNEKLRQLEESGRFDEYYFERKGLNVKKLIEEAIPLSRLGLHLSTPGRDVFITCYADNRNYDAVVEITGFDPRTFKVEVTTTETEDSTLRRQALSRQGHVAFNGPIHRISREIVWEGEMVSVYDEEQRCIDLLLERLRAKVDSKRYTEDTAILVYLTEYRPMSLDSRAELVRRTQHYLTAKATPVPTVYYCYMMTAGIDVVLPYQLVG